MAPDRCARARVGAHWLQRANRADHVPEGVCARVRAMPRQTRPDADPPDDLLTLKQAAALAGKSVDTLRRWRGEHGLRDYRDPADRTAPSVFSRRELLDLLARLAGRRGSADGIVDAVIVDDADPMQTPVHTRPQTGSASPLVLSLVDDLRALRDRLQASADAERERADRAVAALDDARRQTLELGVRLARLETLVMLGRGRDLDAERKRLAERDGLPAPRKVGGKGKGKRKGR